tara:strand:+ start:508 stop:1083 length:576 start_codon:yes stop_codon:yes gene_type:complete
MREQQVSPGITLVHTIASGGSLADNLLQAIDSLPHDVDGVAIVEDDDWYSSRWIQFVADSLSSGSEIVGEAITRYYHLHSSGYRLFDVKAGGRSSLCNTALSVSALPLFKSVLEGSPFIDFRLWQSARDNRLKTSFWADWKPMVVGIKGLAPGYGIGHRVDTYEDKDADREVIKSWIGDDAFRAYADIETP